MNDIAARTKDVAHYIISHTHPSELGAVKLRKVMWYADIAYYRLHGSTITGQESYIRMPQGPVPNHLREVLEELESEDKIVLWREPTPVGERHAYIAVERRDASGFDPEAIEAIHGAIRTICVMSAKEASEATHDPLWASIDNGKQMPVRAASVIPSEIDEEDFAWALKTVEDLPADDEHFPA